MEDTNTSLIKIGKTGDTVEYPAGTTFTQSGTQNVTAGGAINVKSGGSIIIDSGAAITNNGTATGFSADLTNLNATNLTSGTVPDARFPATLPIANGSALTNLNATNLGSGTIPDARFPAALPAISGAALTNLPGGGKIAQVVRMEYGGHQSFTGSAGTYHNTGVTLNITPSATSSKVVGVAYIGTGASADVFTFTDVKNITSGTIVANRNGMCPRSAQVSKNNTTHAFLDSPNSTSAQTYTVRLDGGGATGYVNSRDSGNLNSYSGIVLMEVLA